MTDPRRTAPIFELVLGKIIKGFWSVDNHIGGMDAKWHTASRVHVEALNCALIWLDGLNDGIL